MSLLSFEYLKHLRVQRARELLQRGHPIADVVIHAGFTDQSDLLRLFKRHVGATPGQCQAGC